MKGEYETTEKFLARADDVSAILDPIDVGATYLVPTRTSNFIYNADVQTFNLDDGSSTVRCLYDYKLKASSCWIATSVREDRSGGVDYRIAIGSEQEQLLAMKGGMGVLPHRCDVPVDEAPEIKENLRMAYGLQFEKVDIHYGENRIFNPDPTNESGNKYFTTVIIPVRLTHMVCFDSRDNSVVYQEKF